ELERALFEAKGQYEARRLLDWNNATGTYLGRLAKKLPQRVRQHRSAQSRTWIIAPPHWIYPNAQAEAAETADAQPRDCDGWGYQVTAAYAADNPESSGR